MRLPHKTLERKLFDSGYRYVCAVDEVGMAPLAGPVVVCAVLFTKVFFKKRHKKLYRLRDSKLLSSHQREIFFLELLKEKNFKFQTAYCYPKTIDRLNIYQAARLAMRRAIVALRLAQGDKNNRLIILIDGKTEIKNMNLPQIPIVEGDRKVFSIACASIIAKVFRDKMMKNYAKKFPQYGFEKHKGYPTKFHRAMLVKFGPCLIHRKSFAPVSKLI